MLITFTDVRHICFFIKGIILENKRNDQEE